MNRDASLLRPGRWPLALRVPVLVSLLMIAAAAVLSQGALQRLSRDQERHLAELSAANLDGLATALQPAAIRRDVWETFDALDRAQGRSPALSFFTLPGESDRPTTPIQASRPARYRY